MEPILLNDEIINRAEELLAELEYNGKFEVGTKPIDEPKHSGHKLRAVFVENPKWYQDFCSKYIRYKLKRGKAGRIRQNKTPNHHTLINRRETINALKRIIDYGEARTVYDYRLKDFIEEKLANDKTS